MPLLEAEQLGAGYGSLEVLHAINFSVGEGELVAVLGPNGAGKSTLLGSLARTVRAFSGSIKWDGESIIGARPSDASRRGIAFVPQEGNVFSDLSVRENIVLAVSASTGGARGGGPGNRATDIVFDRFDFLRERAGQPAGLLSGGERQALAVSLAFLQSPRVMLLDEPTAGLSPSAAQNLADWILELTDQGISIVWVVEQNPDQVLKKATRAYLLDGGSFRFSGAAHELVGQGASLLFQTHVTTTEGSTT